MSKVANVHPSIPGATSGQLCGAGSVTCQRAASGDRPDQWSDCSDVSTGSGESDAVARSTPACMDRAWSLNAAWLVKTPWLHVQRSGMVDAGNASGGSGSGQMDRLVTLCRHRIGALGSASPPW